MQTGERAAGDAFNDVKLLCDGMSESKVHEQLGKASFSELQELFHLYLDFLRHNNGTLTCLASYEHQGRATGLYTCLAYDK